MSRSVTFARNGQRVLSRQSGRTLIELLVAMTLGLVIVAAVGSLYFTSSQSTRSSLALSSTEERGRLAMFFLSEPIAMAGFGTITGVSESRFDNLAFSDPHIRACSNGRFADPAAGDFTCVALGAGEVGDALMVSFQADSAAGMVSQGLLTDCLGQAAPIVDGRATVRNVYDLDATSNFTCLGNGGGGSFDLVTGVEDFKVYLAYDQLGHNTGLTQGNYKPTVVGTTLMTPTQIAAMPTAALPATAIGNPWNHVIAVYVCVQLTAAQTGTTLDGTSTFNPCPADEAEAATGTAPVTLNDGVARRTFNRVFTIRSRAQAAAT